VAGHHVVDHLAGRGEIQRQQGLVGGRATGEEQHRVVIGNADQRAQVGLGLRRHRDEILAAVADLHDGRADAVPVEHLGLGLPQDGFGQRRRAGTEVERARHGAPEQEGP